MKIVGAAEGSKPEKANFCETLSNLEIRFSVSHSVIVVRPNLKKEKLIPINEFRSETHGSNQAAERPYFDARGRQAKN